MNIEAGARLGRYRLVQRLGRGGMGTVWKAVDTTLDRYVAVKVLHERHKDNEKVLSRFLREPVALGRLEHPNVARIHLMDELDGLPYFVMDYIEGESLDRVITHDFRPPVKRSLRILIGVADAL
ncbi:MAG: serine/threonine-protein kinase, partial [bacterium]